MSANVDLFVRVLAQIEKHPGTWDQTEYRRQHRCGTAYCFAGTAIHLSGVAWRLDSGSDLFVDSGDMAPDVAADLLGIGRNISYHEDPGGLFNAANTLCDLYRISAQHCGLDEQVLRDKVAAEVADGAVQQ